MSSFQVTTKRDIESWQEILRKNGEIIEPDENTIILHSSLGRLETRDKLINYAIGIAGIIIPLLLISLKFAISYMTLNQLMTYGVDLDVIKISSELVEETISELTTYLFLLTSVSFLLFIVFVPLYNRHLLDPMTWRTLKTRKDFRSYKLWHSPSFLGLLVFLLVVIAGTAYFFAVEYLFLQDLQDNIYSFIFFLLVIPMLDIPFLGQSLLELSKFLRMQTRELRLELDMEEKRLHIFNHYTDGVRLRKYTRSFDLDQVLGFGIEIYSNMKFPGFVLVGNLGIYATDDDNSISKNHLLFGEVPFLIATVFSFVSRWNKQFLVCDTEKTVHDATDISSHLQEVPEETNLFDLVWDYKTI